MDQKMHMTLMRNRDKVSALEKYLSHCRYFEFFCPLFQSFAVFNDSKKLLQKAFSKYQIGMGDLPKLHAEIDAYARKCLGKYVKKPIFILYYYYISFIITYATCCVIEEERKPLIRDGEISILQQKLQSHYIQLQTIKRNVKKVAGH